jgi:hypothetical protein
MNNFQFCTQGVVICGGGVPLWLQLAIWDSFHFALILVAEGIHDFQNFDQA